MPEVEAGLNTRLYGSAAEPRVRVAVAHGFDQSANQLEITGQLSAVHFLTEQVAENPAEVFVSRQRHERP